jgi:hypothetical protein
VASGMYAGGPEAFLLVPTAANALPDTADDDTSPESARTDVADVEAGAERTTAEDIVDEVGAEPDEAPPRSGADVAPSDADADFVPIISECVRTPGGV